MAKKKKRKSWSRFRIDNCDGFEVNTINTCSRVSAEDIRFNPFGSDTYHVKGDNGNYRTAGIQSKIRKLNCFRNLDLNLYKERIKGY